MGTAESGQEVVQRDLVPDVGNGKPKSNAPAVAAPKEVVRAGPNIEQVTWRDARRIVIVIGGARSRYLQTGRSKVGSTARADRTVWCCHRAAAEEANRGLLRGRQCEKVIKSRHGARHQAAIVPPRKAGPGTILLPLIPNVRRLLEGLIVIDTENRRIYRRIEQQASHLGTKETRSVVSHGGVPLEAFDVGGTHTKRHSIDFGFPPTDRKLDRSVEEHIEIVRVRRKFPKVVAIYLDVPAECLLQSHVVLIPASRVKGRLALRPKYVGQAADARGARQKKVLVVRRFKRSRISGAQYRAGGADQVRNSNAGLHSRVRC